MGFEAVEVWGVDDDAVSGSRGGEECGSASKCTGGGREVNGCGILSLNRSGIRRFSLLIRLSARDAAALSAGVIGSSGS